jgi:subtilase family serine protease
LKAIPSAKFLTALLVAAALLLTGLAANVSTPAKAAQHGATPAIGAHPQIVPAGEPSPTDFHFNCQRDRGPHFLRCYDPQQIRTAYNITPLLDAGHTGAGRTIVIIDAFSNPQIQQDLSAFDTLFGLPTPTLNIIAPDGLTPFDPTDPNQVGWAGEIALDVQWAHAIAPGANLDLVLATTNQDADILSATKYAVDHNLGDVISQSFGENESCVDPSILTAEHQLFQDATNKGITLIASSGDQGAAQPTCDGNSWTKAASSPASDPLVTAVGGTELFAAPYCVPRFGCDPTVNPAPGTYQSEVALNHPPGFLTQGSFSTGGGYSKVYAAPQYQHLINAANPGRAVPDVAYSAGINHGVLASCGVCAGVTTPAFFIFGGTSVGSPQWSGLTAIADQMAGRDLGFLNKTIYIIGKQDKRASADFHDTTVGNNTVTEFDANNHPVNVNGFNAAPGWDATTGFGSPNAANLVHDLVNFAQ